MRVEEHKLDNPAWYSLSEIHQHFSIDVACGKFYRPEYGPFGGFASDSATAEAMEVYSLLAADFYVVGKQPRTPPSLLLRKELVCDQMLLEQPVEPQGTEPITQLLTIEQRNDLRALVSLVQPGYFREQTPDLGSYFGIYRDGILVAVTGERMQMRGYTEVSAVVTHPEHVGKGYARQLVRHTCQKIFGEGKIPYLHVSETNRGAIHLYEKLGFRRRRKISFWNYVRTTTTL